MSEKDVAAKKETIGKIATDLLKQTHDTGCPLEHERESRHEYVDNLIECLNTSKKQFVGNFYITILTKKERLLPNVLRNFFFGRHTCPTPDYDQTVYQYVAENGQLKHLWTIPSRDTCLLFKENALRIVDNEKELLRFILDFDDGTLYRLAKKLNDEKMSLGVQLNCDKG